MSRGFPDGNHTPLTLLIFILASICGSKDRLACTRHSGILQGVCDGLCVSWIVQLVGIIRSRLGRISCPTSGQHLPRYRFWRNIPASACAVKSITLVSGDLLLLVRDGGRDGAPSNVLGPYVGAYSSLASILKPLKKNQPRFSSNK